MVKNSKIILTYFLVSGVILFSNAQNAFGEFEAYGNGNLTAVGVPLNEILSSGDPFKIQWFYPRNPIDVDNSNNTGFYSNVTLAFDLNGVVNDFSDSCNIQVINDVDGNDSFNIFCPRTSSNGNPFDPGPLGDSVYNSFSVNMVDNDGIALSDDKLPENMSELTSFWEVKDVNLTYNATINVNNMELEITSPIVGEFNPSPDTDGDGILDDWELLGVDFDFDGDIDLNLPGKGAHPLKKDIFVEIDYMADFIPFSNATGQVIAAFANAPSNLVNNPNASPGINLHLEVDEVIPYQEYVVVWDGFDSLKESYFGTTIERGNESKINAKKYFYRYGMFIEDMQGYGGASGFAELPGNDFIVSLGTFNLDPEYMISESESQAGTLMHELGHTLGLRHGGQVDTNCKPNYLSVMSYSFQMPVFVPSRPLDYSRETLDTLDETNLIESVGIEKGSFPQTLIGFNDSGSKIVSTGAPIDYNGNNNTSDTVAQNINNLFPGGCGSSSLTELNGYSDWNFLIYDFRSTQRNFADGFHPPPDEEPDEMTKDDYDNILSNIVPPACTIPISGDWNVTSSCVMILNATSPSNVLIQNNSLITIFPNVTFSIPSGKNITIEYGSGLLVKKDGILKILS